ncbi:hypothetical protein BDW42DRAFT_192998 [Aspergillus taichungensis]|uniref:Uncharacterized protein n=1 Tax=Aspergillus taichungensis TaxID=482145 RepID=A0A2J5HYG1_9EURO|nr:hypothetical protein BDW42DRAFT_192998 [Aspergillus taichungensis]
MPLIPFLLILTGITLFLSRRRYTAVGARVAPPRVVVKGNTFSEIAEKPQPKAVESRKTDNVRSACVIGAGPSGVLTALVLAGQNPHVQFHVVDSNERRIAAWNSDRVPIGEPGVEELLFKEDAVLVDSIKSHRKLQQTDQEALPGHFPPPPRPRKLLNVNFSTNILGGIAAADMVFLSVDIPAITSTEGQQHDLDLSNLDTAIRAIAQVSRGYKIVVQRGAAPCGTVPYIKKMLKETASPSASFDVLANPEFIFPGTMIHNLLYPPCVIIGHVFSEDSSPEALIALKRLYTSWIPEDRIVTMDAWSAELGKIATHALLAQQISAIHSLGLICKSTKADFNHVTRILGMTQPVGLGLGASTPMEVLCLENMAKEIGMQDVSEYWGRVLGMNGSQQVIQKS